MNIKPAMAPRHRNWLTAIFILVFPAALFLGFLLFLQEPPPPLAPLPNPNGYPDLVKAAMMVKGAVWDYDRADLNQLRDIVATNAQALARARTAMTNQCGVPIECTQAYVTNHLADMLSFRNLAEAFVCEGRLADEENRFGDAADSYLGTVRLGNQVTQGGILMDEMIGIAIVSLGEQQLQGIVTNLDASACRKSAGALEALAANRQTWEATLRQESAWAGRVHGWRTEWLKLIYHSAIQKNRKQATDTIKDTGQREGRLMIDLAARAYELEKGKPPANAADLAPNYLKAVPKDPVTGTDIIYSPR